MTNTATPPKHLAAYFIAAIWTLYAGVLIAYHHYWQYANHTAAWICLAVIAVVVAFFSKTVQRWCQELHDK